MPGVNNLISWWKLNEASGNALDAFGSNHLTDTNTVGAGTGKIDGARDFEFGNSEYFTIDDNASLSMGAGVAMTITGWLKLETQPSVNGGRAVIASKGATNMAAAQEYILFINNSNDKPTFLVGDGSATNSVEWGSTLSLGTWYYICAYHNPVTDLIGISINDGAFVTAAHSTDIQDSTQPFRLGQGFAIGNGHFFDGLLDEVALWKATGSSILARGGISDQDNTLLYNGGNGIRLESLASKGFMMFF